MVLCYHDFDLKLNFNAKATWRYNSLFSYHFSHCPANYTCLSVGDNPNYGYTNFDNFAWSLVTAFQLITMDFWENVFNYVSAQSDVITSFS